VYETSRHVRVERDLDELWIAAKCGESATTIGPASCSTVANIYDKLIPPGL
jgi:(2R)-sulfolactate sulfo-lyase subunit beta